MKEKNTIKINNLKVTYEVEHRDVKHPRVEVKPEKDVLVVLPQNDSNATEILESKEEWISEKLSSIDQKISETGIDTAKIKNKFVLYGDLYNPIFERGKFNIFLRENKIVISTPKHVDDIAYLKNWIRENLRRKLIDYSDSVSKKIGVKYNRLFVRSQKTKWASCSSRGNLNFNIKVGALPEELIRYLVLHEAAHLKENKHSSDFWSILENLCPSYKEKEKLLIGYWFLIPTNEIWREISRS